MTKQIEQLIQAIHPQRIVGDVHQHISDVTNDSRQVKKGTLFVAIKGVSVDAHQFIPDVVAAGATAIVCETLPAEIQAGVTYIQVSDSVFALSHIADEWFDHPSRRLRLVGVTGTNGKTTTATLLYEMARLMGHKAGLLSTVKNVIDTTELPAKQTHLTT